MRDFFEDGARPPRRAYVRQGSNWSLQNAGQQDYTPSTLNAYARNIIEGSFPPIHVRGEVTGWKRYATSGHCYFTLRDRGAQVRCVMFSRDAARLPADPEEGMEVRVFGTLTLYERRGDFQLGVRELVELLAARQDRRTPRDSGRREWPRSHAGSFVSGLTAAACACSASTKTAIGR